MIPRRTFRRETERRRRGQRGTVHQERTGGTRPNADQAGSRNDDGFTPKYVESTPICSRVSFRFSFRTSDKTVLLIPDPRTTSAGLTPFSSMRERQHCTIADVRHLDVLVFVFFDQIPQHVEVIELGRGQVVPIGQFIDDLGGRVQCGIIPDRSEGEPPDQGQVSRVRTPEVVGLALRFSSRLQDRSCLPLLENHRGCLFPIFRATPLTPDSPCGLRPHRIPLSVVLPLTLVIFAVCQDSSDVDFEPIIVDDCNKPVFILLDIEDVNFPTGSAWGKSALASWTSFQRAFLATRYHRNNGACASGCLSPAVARRFFEMICTRLSPAAATHGKSIVFRLKTVKALSRCLASRGDRRAEGRFFPVSPTFDNCNDRR